jgi:hypothetical protein
MSDGQRNRYYITDVDRGFAVGSLDRRRGDFVCVIRDPDEDRAWVRANNFANLLNGTSNE